VYKVNKNISEPFRDSLRSIFWFVKSEMTDPGGDEESWFTILSALVRRWILVIRYLSPATEVDGSEHGEESVRRDFVKAVLVLGDEYDYTVRHEENNAFAIRCAELQYRFLMSSDLYETPGLISIFHVCTVANVRSTDRDNY
jgi:hypothetical protein